MGHSRTRVEVFRAKAGMTQAQLAEASGVSRDVITAIETQSARRVRLLQYARIATALGVDMEDLLEAEEALA